MVDVIKHSYFHLFGMIARLNNKYTVFCQKFGYITCEATQVVNIGVHVICRYDRRFTMFTKNLFRYPVGKELNNGRYSCTIGRLANRLRRFHTQYFHASFLKRCQHGSVIAT